MVEFEVTMGGFDIRVNGELFGRLQREHGFFTDPTVVKKFLEVSSTDLVKIAKKADEVKKYGNLIPICPVCKGTPNFPYPIQDPADGVRACDSGMHPEISSQNTERRDDDGKNHHFNY